MSRRRFPVDKAWIVAREVVTHAGERPAFATLLERPYADVIETVLHRQQAKSSYVTERWNDDDTVARAHSRNAGEQPDRGHDRQTDVTERHTTALLSDDRHVDRPQLTLSEPECFFGSDKLQARRKIVEQRHDD